MGRAFPYVLLFALALAVHGSFVFTGNSPVVDGDLIGLDTYMRLVRVTQLFETGSWYDHTIPRSNAPFGEVLTWTRPFDVMLLAGAWVLKPLMGFKGALYWFGAWISPLLHATTALATAWAVTPFFDRRGRILTAMMVIALPAVILNSLPGRPDHHALLVLTFVVALGFAARLLLRPYSRGLALATGAAAGFGIWLSVEFLAALGAVFAATAIHWILAGGDGARKNLGFALGLVLMMAAAIVLEYLPSEYLAVGYDRISVVHLYIAVLAFGFWATVTSLDGRGLATAGGRAAVAVLGAVVTGTLLWLVYPKFFGGPMVDVDPRYIELWANRNLGEFQSLWPTDLLSLGWFLFYLGPALICVPFVIWLLAAERRSPLWPGWLLIGLALAMYLPLGLLHIRFAPFTEIPLLMILIVIFDRFQAWFQWRTDRLIGQLTRAMVSAVILVGFFASGVMVTALLAAFESPSQAKEAVPRAAPCMLRELAPSLNDPRGLGARAHTILSPIPAGPQLLYRTKHRVIGTPYIRNGSGVADTYAIFTATDDTSSRPIIDRRGIDLILLCDNAGPVDTSRDPAEFHRRLLDGKLPPWIRRVELPPEAGRFRLFEVIR